MWFKLYKRICFNKYCEEWKNCIENKPKLRTYKNIKCSFGTEEYVKMNLTRPQRSILAQIRLGILPLFIETGRYTGVKIENRICSLCNQNKVENELHFLLTCTYYKNERSAFFRNLDRSNFSYSQADNFKILCSLYPRQLSKYISSIWNKRKEAIYR